MRRGAQGQVCLALEKPRSLNCRDSALPANWFREGRKAKSALRLRSRRPQARGLRYQLPRCTSPEGAKYGSPGREDFSRGGSRTAPALRPPAGERAGGEGELVNPWLTPWATFCRRFPVLRPRRIDSRYARRADALRQPAVVALADLLILLARGVKLRHLMRERFHLFFNFLQAPKDGETFLQNRAPGEGRGHPGEDTRR